MYCFTHAIVRKPGRSITLGLRAEDTGAPDWTLFTRHHAAYVDALVATGTAVTVLEPLEAFPDSVFVEDAALCLGEGAVLLRPGASSRRGEPQTLAPTLSRFYDQIDAVESPGFIDGGDVLTRERDILVGLSARTNRLGAEALREIVRPWGYRVRILRTPPDILHFKTDCSLLDEDTLLSTRRLSATGCFDGYRLIHTAEGEEAAANTVRCNDLVLMPKGFAKTADRLVQAGYTVKEIDNSEAAKLDGGMSCLSLRFSPPRGGGKGEQAANAR